LPLTYAGLCTGEHRDRVLHESAGKYFGPWRSALKAAGLDAARVLARPRRYPDGNAVIAEIQRRAAARLPLKYAGLRTGEHRDRVLHESAGKRFGSWSAALKAAEMKP
jgi:hypothetical protein